MQLSKTLFHLVFCLSFSATVIAGDSYFEKAKLAEENEQYQEAFELYLKSAEEEGNAEAGFKIATEYRGRDEEKALKWYHWAADRGSCWAQHVLGDIYDRGDLNLEQDYAEAMKWYLIASKNDTTVGCSAWVRQRIGFMYYYGLGVTKDVEEAVNWYWRAALGGWTPSQLQLGVMLRDGKDVRRNYSESVQLFRMAAEDGDPNGKNYLGEMYEQGKGVLQNYLEAVKWYKDAALHGNHRAQHNLARMYRDGLGVEKDLSEAYVWYSLAALTEPIISAERDGIGELLNTKSLNESQKRTKEVYDFIETQR